MKGFMEKSLIGIVFWLVTVTCLAQKGRVEGVVKDAATGETLIGASVVVHGTTYGCITDIDGHFVLDVADKKTDQLKVSFIGYDVKVVKISGKSNMDITLESVITELDEVVAIGYGTMKKRDVSGSVASVSIPDIEKVPVSDISQALTGRISGVQIQTSEGAPGSSVSIKIRGGGSITQSNEPLYVIDGFPTEEGMSMLDPQDIESIDILKDASSTAIYGARGANGVVLITTKGGKAGKTAVTYDGYMGISQMAKKLDVLSPYDFVMLDYERSQGDEDDLRGFNNLYGEWSELESLYGDRPGVDWQEEAFGGNAISSYHKVGVTGGNKETRFNLSVSRLDQEGQMIESGFEKTMAKLKLDHKASKRLKANGNFSYTEAKSYGMGTSSEGSNFNKMQHIMQYRPTIGKDGDDQDLIDLDEDPALEDESGNVMQNPIASAQSEDKSKTQRSIVLNGGLKYKIFSNLEYSFSAGMKYSDIKREEFYGSRSVTSKRKGGAWGSIRADERMGWSYTNLLTFEKRMNDLHYLQVMLGQEEVYSQTRWFSTGASMFPNDDIGLDDLSQGALPLTPYSYREDSRMLSCFGRANYNYQNRYYLTATFRVDGSSKFGKGNKYGYFPSFQAAWRLKEEGFLQDVDWLSNLKMRLSYGVSGNNRIGNYASLSVYGSGSYPYGNQSHITAYPNLLPNPDLKWETTYSTNLGFDFGFLNQRIQVVADLYRSHVKDLLLKSQVNPSSGYQFMMKNVGETENKGLELGITSVNVKTKDFEWTTNLNITWNRKEVLALNKGEDFSYWSSNWGGIKGNDYIVKVGEPVGLMYGYVTDGLYQVEEFDYDAATRKYTLKKDPNNPDRTIVPDNPVEKPQPGYWKYKDIDGDGRITDEDRTVIGDANPIHFGGLNNTFRYKDFDLSVFLNWSYGGEVYNANKLYYTLAHKRNKNMLGAISDRWTEVDADGNMVTDPQQLAELNKGKSLPVWDGYGQANPVVHSWGMEDGSFLRISNVTLGYTLPKRLCKKIHMKKLRVYSTVNNLYTFTNYTGFDPEVSTRNSSGVTPNVDWGAYPRSRTYVFGVNLAF